MNQESKTISPDQQLVHFQKDLPDAPSPVGVYKPILIVGNLIYVSGHGPLLPDGSLIRGKVGSDLNMEEGKNAARQVGLAILATLKKILDHSTKLKGWLKCWAWSTALLILKNI